MMNRSFLIYFIISLSLVFQVQSLCLGFLCSCVPWVSKTCCGVFHQCCMQYQAWLSPLIGEDVVGEYIDALASEAIGDMIPDAAENLGLPDRAIVTESSGGPDPAPLPANVLLAAIPRPIPDQQKPGILYNDPQPNNRYSDRRRFRGDCSNCWKDK